MVQRTIVEHLRGLSQAIAKDKGGILTNSLDSLTKGRFYFLGINPGGRGGETIDQYLNRLHAITGSAFDEPWATAKVKYQPGNAPLQKNVKKLFAALTGRDEAYAEVCATNLIFMTSGKTPRNAAEQAEKCWPLHQAMLDIVHPEVIIAHGKLPFDFICGKYPLLEKAPHPIETGYKHLSWRWARCQINGAPALLIGLPHLSRYSLRSDDGTIEQIKKKAEEFRG